MKRSKQKEPDQESNSKKRKKRLIMLLVFLLVAVLPLLAFNKWANQSSSQTIVINNTASKPAAAPKFQSLKTDYYSVVIPSGWKIRKDIDQHTPTRLHVLAYAVSGNSQAAITSDVLPSEGLVGVADYHSRVIDTSRYTPISSSSFPVGSKAFKDISGAIGETVFMIHGERYASLTTSGQDTFSQSSSLLNTMVTSWQWVE